MGRLDRLSSRLGAKTPTDHAIRIALGLFLLSGAVAGTSASFNASTRNPAAVIANDALYPPGAVTAAASGNDVGVSWASAGSMGSGATTFGHRVRELAAGVEAGTRDGQDPPTSACTTSSSFTTVSANVANNVLTWTASAVASTTNAGSFMCYVTDTQYPQGASPIWFSQALNANQVSLVQIGNVVKSVQFVNAGTAGTLAAGDSIVFSFAQPITNTTGPTAGQGICVRSNVLNFGRAAGTCGTSETVSVGKLTGITNGSTTAWAATWTWGGCVSTACTTLTALVGVASQGSTSTIAGLSTGVFTPSTTTAKLTSATGAVAICTSSPNNTVRTCLPTPFGTV